MEASGRLRERLAFAQNMICETPPVIQVNDEYLDLFAKLEFCNSVGSIKDRPALWILKRAIERGQVTPETTVIESSSGNFACALAVFCHVLQLDFVPVIDPNTPPLLEAHLRTYCKRVVKVEAADESGGYLRTRLHTVQQLLGELSSAYWTNQYGNMDAMDAHYRYTGEEIWRAVSGLEFVFVGVSSAGTIAGVSCRLKEYNSSLRIIAVDVEGSAIFRDSPRPRHISGMGSSIVPPLISSAVIDDVVIVSERETVRGCHQLLQQHGLFVGPSSGGVYSAVQNYFRNGVGTRRPRALFLCADRGTAYVHSIFNASWAASILGEATA
jgi:2,3-diaminopropionate biosynthesis protein SbnA